MPSEWGRMRRIVQLDGAEKSSVDVGNPNPGARN